MRIQRVAVESLRGIAALELQLGAGSNPSWTVLAGRNGTGKTTLLQAIAMAAIGRTNFMQLAARPEQFVRVGHDRFQVEVLVSAGPDDVRDARSDEGSMGFTWGQHVASDRPPGKSRHLPHRLWEPRASGGGGWCFLAYGTGRFSVSSARQDDPTKAFGRRGAAVATLFRRELSLTSTQAWIGAAFSRSHTLFGPEKAALPMRVLQHLLTDGLMPFETSASDVELKSDGIWIRRPEGMIPVEQVGQGLEAISLLVTDILRQMSGIFGDEFMGGPTWAPDGTGCVTVPHSGVILIDEMENHLHPQLQQHIGFWLKQHFPNVQFIVTTHSPFVCQAADSGALFLIEDSGRVAAVADEVFRRVVNGSLDNAVVTDLFGLPYAYSPRSRELRKELAAIESRILSGETLGAADEAKRGALLDELPRDPLTEIQRLDAALAEDP